VPEKFQQSVGKAAEELKYGFALAFVVICILLHIFTTNRQVNGVVATSRAAD